MRILLSQAENGWVIQCEDEEESCTYVEHSITTALAQIERLMRQLEGEVEQ